LRDIKPPVDIPSGWEWAWWLLGGVVLVILAWWLWRYFRQREAARPLPPPVPPHVRARRRLEEALRLLSEPKPFVVAVSDALRAYLEERFSFRAPERTTEEFLHELRSTNLLDAGQKERLSDFLQRCDLVKFAKYEPREMELRDLHASALRLVDETEPRELEPTQAAT
jgi:hypothetical protein